MKARPATIGGGCDARRTHTRSQLSRSRCSWSVAATTVPHRTAGARAAREPGELPPVRADRAAAAARHSMAAWPTAAHPTAAQMAASPTAMFRMLDRPACRVAGVPRGRSAGRCAARPRSGATRAAELRNADAGRRQPARPGHRACRTSPPPNADSPAALPFVRLEARQFYASAASFSAVSFPRMRRQFRGGCRSSRAPMK
jgi:hypothetical protein